MLRLVLGGGVRVSVADAGEGLGPLPLIWTKVSPKGRKNFFVGRPLSPPPPPPLYLKVWISTGFDWWKVEKIPMVRTIVKRS